MRAAFLVTVALAALAGCLPSSGREQTTTLLPSDSLSRAAAAGVPTDTLARVWASADTLMQLPTSLAWLDGAADTTGAPGRIVVADTRGGALHVWSARGAYAGRVDVGAEAFPYLAGARGDTLGVLARGASEVRLVAMGAGGRVVGRVPVEASVTAALLAPAGTPGRVWVKHATDGALVRVALLDGRGREVRRHPLPGPYWRHLGFLRSWSGGVLSLAGYRPVVDGLPAGARAGTPPDTLALVGFDSPQFVRSHQFVRGEVDEPPLLSSAAVGVGDSLFVLNMRTSEVRVEVYARDAPGRLRLRRALVYPAPLETTEEFPADLAVRPTAGGAEIAVLLQGPGGIVAPSGGRVLMLRWTASGSGAAAGPEAEPAR